MESSPTATISVSEKHSPPRPRQNQVSTALLSGVPIVCLRMDDIERLCLAQISNTLLKGFSYNEIHNRRVALGITCVQCTPVQLEILRRAGAMPISSRRCGMITKREAERLVKSFLEDNSPPKLPDNFSFDVYHKCGWGCQGKFMPSRYNSSRAKCIKCTYCSLFFSPNKFIFHCHRTPGANYTHPDAANFNSWRRHLRLYNVENRETLEHAWEDVKAMFNGGSRKRATSSHLVKSSSPVENIDKRRRLDVDITVPSMGKLPYPYPMFTVPSSRSLSGFFPRSTHPAFPVIPLPSDHVTPSTPASIMADMFKGKYTPMFPAYSSLWGRGVSTTTPTSAPGHLCFADTRNPLYHSQVERKIKDENRLKMNPIGPYDSTSYSAFHAVAGRGETTHKYESDVNLTSSESEEDDTDDGNEVFDDRKVEACTVKKENDNQSTPVTLDKPAVLSTPETDPDANTEHAHEIKLSTSTPSKDNLREELDRLVRVREKMENQYQQIKESFPERTPEEARTRESNSDASKDDIPSTLLLKNQIKEAECVMLEFSRKMAELRDCLGESGVNIG